MHIAYVQIDLRLENHVVIVSVPSGKMESTLQWKVKKYCSEFIATEWRILQIHQPLCSIICLPNFVQHINLPTANDLWFDLTVWMLKKIWYKYPSMFQCVERGLSKPTKYKIMNYLMVLNMANFARNRLYINSDENKYEISIKKETEKQV